jgi:hypothetical protein
MGPTAIYKPFSKLPLTIPGAHGVHFSIRLQPRDQHPVIYVTAVPGLLFILSPWGTLFFISWSGTRVHSHTYQIHDHIFDSLQILFTLGIWFSCVQVLGHHPSSTTPSGIYSVLACSLSHCIALSFPVTPSDVYLWDPHSRICSTHTSILHIRYCYPVAFLPT